MKHRIAALIAAGLVATQAPANEAPEITEEKCRELHDYAGKIMHARQLDVPAPQVMDVVKGNKLHEVFVRQAYIEPGYLTDENKQRAVDRFANAAYLDCLDRM